MHILQGVKTLILQTPAQLASHLRSLRKTRGLTQAALGRLIGLDQTRIAKIERDPRRVSVGLLLQLLAALRVKVLLAPNGNHKPGGTKPTEW